MNTHLKSKANKKKLAVNYPLSNATKTLHFSQSKIRR